MATNVPLPSVGVSGVDVRNSNRTPEALAPQESRRALLEEGASAFLVVLALGGLDSQVSQLLSALLGETGQVRLDRRLGAAHRERRVLGDLPEVVVRVGLELGRRHETLDEAHRQRFAVVDRPRGVQDVLRVRGADQVDELADRVRAIDDAQARGRNAELRALGGEAQVACHRDRHRPAHAEAEDHRDRRLGALANGRVSGRGLLVVTRGTRRVLALLPELRDVGARGERHGARAAIDDRPDRVGRSQLLGHARELGPHRQADRVAHRRPVDDDRRDRPIVLHQNVRHASTSTRVGVVSASEKHYHFGASGAAGAHTPSVSAERARVRYTHRPWARVLTRGQTLRIIDLEGRQAVDFLCYNAANPEERYNAADTMKYAKTIFLTRGHGIYSDLGRRLLTIVEDTCGRHDTIGGCCSAESNELRYGVKDTPSCRANFLRALAPFDPGQKDVVANLNFFMNVPVESDGTMGIVDGLSKPGGHA